MPTLYHALSDMSSHWSLMALEAGTGDLSLDEGTKTQKGNKNQVN